MSQPSSQQVQTDFLAAYDEYADGIFRFCVLKTSDSELAQDLMQETFTKTWDYLQKGNSIDSFKAFLFRTARNIIIDYYRKKKSVSLDSMEEEVGFLPPDTTSLDAEHHAEASRAIQAIDSLPNGYRDPVYLRFVEGLPPKEIAAILDLTENVTSVRINRGIAKLRELLGTTH